MKAALLHTATKEVALRIVQLDLLRAQAAACCPRRDKLFRREHVMSHDVSKHQDKVIQSNASRVLIFRCRAEVFLVDT